MRRILSLAAIILCAASSAIAQTATIVDCATNLVTASGLTGYVSAAPCNCSVVKTEVTTWGSIKAMYLSDDDMQGLIRRQK